MRRLSLIVGGAGLLALPLLATAAGGDTTIPWPAGHAPSDLELAEGVADALDLLELERFEEFRDAKERGEDSGHIRIYQEDIDAGRYTVDDLFQFGDGVFGHEFRDLDGYGDNPAVSVGRRVHEGRLGGRDNFSCAGCHSLGGPDGAGSATQNALLFGDGESLDSALPRNSPALLGGGMVQELAHEMSFELRVLRDDALEQARTGDQTVTVALLSKGIDFGQVVARPDGSVDTTGLEGVDADLVVRPFGWKGQFATLRRAVEDAARVHFGVQSSVIAERHRDTPMPELLGPGPDWWDPDGDGRQRELEEGSLTAAAVYLATLEVPTIVPPSSPSLRDRWARGDALFDEVGCEDCHRRGLGMRNTVWLEYPDTTGAEPFAVELFHAGEEPKGTPNVLLFSDLKRHDMGPELAEAHTRTGHPHIPAATWLTRPLWGLAETAPYLHDGRAATIPDAILAHGGEASDSRDAFEALPAEDQASLHVFLLSLSRAPKLRGPL